MAKLWAPHHRYHSLDGTAPQYELDFMSDRDDILNPEMAKLDAGKKKELKRLVLTRPPKQ